MTNEVFKDYIERKKEEWNRQFGHYGEIINGKKSLPDEMEAKDFLSDMAQEIFGCLPKRKDTTPYSGNLTKCCNEPEKEGEDGITYCSGCEKNFPELVGEEWNSCRSTFLENIKNLTP
jgi:hypothetical protein